MKYFIATLLLLITSLTGYSLGQMENIIKANKAYSAGSFTTAADLYNKVVTAGYEAPELFYNLGNTYFKMNDYSHAILWYERAKRLDPGNEDIDFNLNVANTKISDKIEPLPELFYKRWFNAMVQLFSVDSWATFGILFFIAGLLGGVLYMASHILILRKAGFWSAFGFIFLSVFTLMMAWSSFSFTKSTAQAIVFAPTITVKSSPDEKSTDLFVVHEGTKVRLIDNINGWFEIKIANGSVGWLPVSSLEKI
ncbi:MAG: tetratricopeptide repeat protein [Bacteroidota bacterium]